MHHSSYSMLTLPTKQLNWWGGERGVTAHVHEAEGLLLHLNALMKWDNASENKIIKKKSLYLNHRPEKVNPLQILGQGCLPLCRDPKEPWDHTSLPESFLSKSCPGLVPARLPRDHLCNPQHLPSHSHSPEILPNTYPTYPPSPPRFPV